MKDIAELKTDNERLQKEVISLEEKNSLYMEQVKDKDNYLETVKKQIEDLDCQREANLTYIDELQTKNESLQKEIHSLEEKYSRYNEEMKGKDNYLQELKKRIEDINSRRKKNLKYLEDLETKYVNKLMQIHSLKEENSVYVEQVKEKDSYLETLKRDIADLNCAREANLKCIDEVKADISIMQTYIHLLREHNAMYLEQLNKKDNYLGMLKQQIEDLNYAREKNLKDVDELRANNECLQKEIISLEEKNSVYMEQLKEKDNYLAALKQEFEDTGSERETNLGYGDEQQINSRMEKEINFITEENTLYREQLKEKDIHIEELKQPTEDVNSVNKSNLICIKQLHDQNKCESLKCEKEPKSQEYGVLAEQVVCCNTHVPAELCVFRSLSSKSQEIELCRNMMLKEISDHKPDYDVESRSQSQLPSPFAMEKGMEVFHSLQDHMNEIHTQANEAEKEYAKKDKQKECLMRQLKAQIEHLQAYVPMQQPKDALVCVNNENSSSVSEYGSYTENLHLRHLFSARVAHSVVEDCGTDASEKRKLEEQLKICMEEMAMTNKNETLAYDIADLQKKFERYCVEKNSLEISLETLEEEKKTLESQLTVSHKRLLDAESEVQELKLKVVAMRNNEAAQENSALRFRTEELGAEVEHYKIGPDPLLKESRSAWHNIGKHAALCCCVQSHLTETASVLKSSAATNTDISGTLFCVYFTKFTLVNWSV